MEIRHGNASTLQLRQAVDKSLPAALGAGSYESPAMSVVEIATEGVLCSSLTDGSEGGFGDLEDGGDLF